MVEIDIRSFFFIFSSSNFIIAVFLTASSVSLKSKQVSVLLYATAKLFYSISFLLFALRGSISPFLSIPISNTILFIAFALEIFVLINYDKNRTKTEAIKLGFITLMFILVFISSLNLADNFRILIASMFTSFFYGYGSLKLYINKRRSILKNFTISLFILTSLLFAARGATAALVKTKDTLLSFNIIQFAAYYCIFIVPHLTTFILFMLIKEVDDETLQKNKLQIEQDNLRLKQLNATKDKMFSIIGHDLRSPLATISTYLSLLEIVDEKNKKTILSEHLSDLQELAMQTITLTTNLFEWAKSQLNEIQYKPEHIFADTLIADVVRLYKNQSNSKGIELRQTCKESLTVFADPMMLKTVLRNLVSNAIKFSPPRRGRVEIICETIQNSIIITVKDNGHGIHADKLNSLFVFSENKSTDGTLGEKGTGLGLVLCYELIAKNKGELEVQSTIDKGTSFRIHLPNL